MKINFKIKENFIFKIIENRFKLINRIRDKNMILIIKINNKVYLKLWVKIIKKYLEVPNQAK